VRDSDRGQRLIDEASEEADSLDASREVGPPLIDPGLYRVRSLRVRSADMFDRRKLVLDVQIIGDDQGHRGGRWDGTELLWSANIPMDRTRPPVSSKYWRALELVLGRRLRRSEKPAKVLLTGQTFLARVKTVTKNHRGDVLPPQSHYSVCSDLLRWVG
jgi:hypothetical protein